MGTDGLILQVQTREEIMADKWVALVFRPNRVQYRDLWDLLWLDQQGIKLDADLVFQKLNDRKRTRTEFAAGLVGRLDDLEKNPEHQQTFRKEMERFLPASEVRAANRQAEFWSLLMFNLRDHAANLLV